MKHLLRSALLLALAAASGTAAALGLGQIQVKSKLGQPLLAEIPIITSDPGELEGLMAQQPGPEVFERVGIQPPTGLAARLQYAYAVDARGNPVIRITTEEPVQEPLLTFVVEVNSASSRLVREYSALVDAPAAVASAAQPAVEMPTVAPPNVIERPVVEGPVQEALAAVPDAPAPEPEPSAAEPSAPEEALPAEVVAAAEPQPEPEPVVESAPPMPSPAPVAAAAPVAPEAADATATAPSPAVRPDQYRVQKGQTLSEIANEVGAGTLDQSMVALLRANPDAFVRGNINALKAGAVLRVPDAADMDAVELAEARALVRAQMQEWRQHRSVRQPELQEGVASATDAADGAAQGARSARLEIVPPGASQSERAGNQSGASAGGEGQMLRQELSETKETLAAREAEVNELKSRVTELEQLQADQQQLIAMKDTELAAVQKRLADAQSEEAGGSVDLAEVLPWAGGGSALLAFAILGAWLLRRRARGSDQASGKAFKAPADTRARRPSIADSVPIPPRHSALDEPFAEQLSQEARAQAMARARAEAALGDYGPVPTAPPEASAPVAASPSRQHAEEPVHETHEVVQPEPLRAVGAAGPVVAQASLGGDAVQLPFWDRRQRQPVPSGRAQAPNLRSVPSTPTPASSPGPGPVQPVTTVGGTSAAPAWHTAAPAGGPPQDPAATDNTGSGHDRLELAQAYLDLGDQSSARQLLGEVVVNGDLAARQKAARMLRELE